MPEQVRIWGSDLLSHGYVCLAEDPRLRGIFIVEDVFIWLSYCVISVTLFLASKGSRLRRDVIYAEFIVFIFLCGQTHMMDVLNKFSLTPEAHGWLYRIDAYGVRSLTALCSAVTAAVLISIFKPLQAAFQAMPAKVK